ncbi:MAG: isochorismatase family protein [Acidimicrobiales bacterium]
MALDLTELIDPAHTAIVTQECQGAVIGSHAALPQLAESAHRVAVPNIARLVRAARAVDVPVVHCLAMRRDDGKGSNHNARLFMGVLKSGVPLRPGTEAVEVIPEIGVEPGDVQLSRLHGLGPMGGTDLDAVLRNLGVTTVVGVGVSVNVGMLNFVMDAVNAGYQFVMPRDAVAGVPEEYATAVLDNTISLLATLPTTDEVLAAWSA